MKKRQRRLRELGPDNEILYCCSGCGEMKPASEYYPNGNRPHCYCKDCSNAKTRQDYQSNRGRYLKAWADLYESRKTRIVEGMGGRCQRCGYHEFLSGLDFHHVNPDEKDGGMVKYLHSGPEQRAWDEADKCMLLCACCHGAFERGDWLADFVKRDGLGWTIAAVREAAA